MKFTEPAQVIDKDSIFVPIGWDSPAKMSVISEGKMSVCRLGPGVCSHRVGSRAMPLRGIGSSVNMPIGD